MSKAETKTQKVIAELAKECSTEEKDVLGDFAGWFQVTKNTVELDSPCSLTVVMPGSRYRKDPFIGGEEFSVCGAYQGKRDIILKLKEIHGTREIEIPSKEAEEKMLRYPALVEEFYGFYGLEEDESMRESAATKAAQLEKEAHDKAVMESRMEDARFGSW